MNELVSVIIPTCKRPHFLSRAVDSVLGQTYPYVEVVVVDDNAPDTPERAHTIDVMRQYHDNPRVTYVLNDHPMGGGPARNHGIEQAQGSYITFLDDDDIYLPEKVGTQLRFTIDNDLEMSFTDVYLCDGNGRLVEYRRHSYVKDCSNNELMRQHILHSLGPTSTFMVRRSSVLAAGGFADVPMGQDFMLMWRMIEFGTKIGYLPVSHIVQYLHDGGRISVGPNKINGENRLYKLKQTKAYLLSPSEKKYVDFRHWAVLSVTARRSHMPLAFLKYGVKAVFVSPVYFLRETLTLFTNRMRAETPALPEATAKLVLPERTERTVR